MLYVFLATMALGLFVAGLVVGVWDTRLRASKLRLRAVIAGERARLASEKFERQCACPHEKITEDVWNGATCADCGLEP